MNSDTLIGFAAVVVLLLLWSAYSKERGFGGGFMSALVTLVILGAVALLVVRLLGL
ncbi:MAG TPA: hypothetical protein VKB31_08335 [Trueperaceae bacterium]|nr:hypothetical protein [Trueperaceae bacterium]